MLNSLNCRLLAFKALLASCPCAEQCAFLHYTCYNSLLINISDYQLLDVLRFFAALTNAFKKIYLITYPSTVRMGMGYFFHNQNELP
jgi:hypothetical protein